MKTINLKNILAIAILFYSPNAFSQTTTTTILYDTSSHLSTTKCNVFDTARNVAGLLHGSVIGAATFSTTNGLTLPTNYTFSSAQTKRSDYRISYPFKNGYIYRIEITAFGDVSNSSAYPSLGTALFTTGLTYTSTSCVAGDIAGFPLLGSLFIITVNNTPTLYSPPNANFTCPNNYDYLVLEATCQAAQNITANMYIKKIVIKETPPISFTIPPTIIIPCGSTGQQSLTVTNVYSTTGITNYIWNLGATPNNWLYNNVAAPATVSTGTANTISLTPVCGSTPKNVSATVTANGNTYTTGTSTVSITPPSLSINGSPVLCTQITYSLSGAVPCGGSVTWSSSNINVMTVNQSTGLATKVANGTANIIATIGAPNPCGIPAISMPVSVGAVTTGPIKVGPSTPYDIEVYVNEIPGATSYNWYKNGVIVPNQHLSAADISMSCGINTTIAVEAVSSCGTSAKVSKIVKTLCNLSIANNSTSMYAISPNPSNGDITVSEKSVGNNASNILGKNVLTNRGDFKIEKIVVYNSTGMAVKKIKFNGIKNSFAHLSDLINGSYYIEIICTNGYREKQLIILQKQ